MKKIVRILRWLFHGMAAMSLFLCVATAAMWVRSHFCDDTWIWIRGGEDKSAYAESKQGRIFAYDGFSESMSPVPSFSHDVGPITSGTWDYVLAFGGLRQFGYHTFHQPFGVNSVEVMFPYWLATLVPAILPLVEIRYVLP